MTTSTIDAPSIYDAAEARLAELRNSHSQAERALHAAKDDAAELRTRLRRGDASVTASAMAKADAAIERATLLAEAAKQALARHERTMPVRPVLSQAVAPLLEATTGALVEVAHALPKTEELHAPVIYVVQKGLPKVDKFSGHLSGELELNYVRQALHAPLPTAKIDRAILASKDIYGQCGDASTSERGEFFLDRTRLLVRAVYPEVMRLPATPPSWAANQLAHAFAADLIEYTPAAPVFKGVTIGAGGTGYVYPVKVEVAGSKITSCTVIEGKRITTTMFTLDLHPRRRGSNLTGYKSTIAEAKKMARNAREVAKNMIGQPASGLGRVINAEVKPIAPRPTLGYIGYEMVHVEVTAEAMVA